MTANLAPSVLRIGGTSQDQVRYSVDGKGIPFSHNLWGNSQVFDCRQLEDISQFALDVGADLIFGLNAAWPRLNFSSSSSSSSCSWISDNAAVLLSYAKEKGIQFTGLELGNEPNSFYQHDVCVNAKQLAFDFAQLKASLPLFYGKDVPLIGPDVSVGLFGVWNIPDFFCDFVSETAKQEKEANSTIMDVYTWHYYGLSQDVRVWDNGTIGRIEDPVYMNQFLDRAVSFQNCVNENYDFLIKNETTERVQHKKRLPKLHQTSFSRDTTTKPTVWVGETASVSGGGLVNASDRFVSSLWYADQLGMFSQSSLLGFSEVNQTTSEKLGPLMIRQQLIGGNYGLIVSDPLMENYSPTPDYWIAILFKTLTSPISFQTSTKGTLLSDQMLPRNDVRAYAFCASPAALTRLHLIHLRKEKNDSAMMVVLINVRPGKVFVELPILSAGFTTACNEEKDFLNFSQQKKQWSRKKNVQSSSSPTKGPDDISAPSLTESLSTATESSSSSSSSSLEIERVVVYSVTSDSLTSSQTYLNGQSLQLGEHGELPGDIVERGEERIVVGGGMALDPHSITFLMIPFVQ